MGIRMLHRRTGPDRARPQGRSSARSDGKGRAVTGAGLPAFAAGAGALRVPATTAMAARRSAAGLLRRLTRGGRYAADPRETPAWRLWADTGLAYLYLLLARLPRKPRATGTVTVFVAAPVGLRRPES
ncbi:hypothetical protein FNH09_29020 [Streptomyces adustus]|uniref:Uncharacterized protein n=1 Tax=Streptomyces adustus TaxID=1609272 RepID=A0A5N8VIU2_9ACTN|nr:hypothetical protein [Streptomyces adustus]MPY35137.1 hypothetical protein [Streptomyces adustus]